MTLDYARARLEVARAQVVNLLLDYEPDHPRVRDARESVRGWADEVARRERDEEAEVLAVARLTAGEAAAWRGSDQAHRSVSARSAPAVSCVCGDPGDCQECA